MQVFISHDKTDADLAKELGRYLEAQGFQVFDPWRDLFPGDNWHLEIGKALEASEAMVVLISPSAVRSSWVQSEIQYALGSERFEDRLIPVEVEPTQGFPWVLRDFQWIKLEGDPAETSHRVARLLQAAGEPELPRHGRPIKLPSPVPRQEKALSLAQEQALERLLNQSYHLGGQAPSRDELHER